jgi:uncharacterized membrane protein (UPF0136 family)
MKAAGIVLFSLGLAAYAAALLHMGTTRGEMYSDVGNALLLVTTVVLLLRPRSAQ